MMLSYVAPNVCIDVTKRVRAIPSNKPVYTWEIPFPDEFIRSKNKKSVQVLSATVFKRNSRKRLELLHHLTFHSTFVQDATIDNNLICFADYTLYRALTFEQYTSLFSYKVWFEDPFVQGENRLNLNDENLIVKLELRYVY